MSDPQVALVISRMPGCFNCVNCIPIGMGDHVCDFFDNSPLVMSDYNPTDDYLCCYGDGWARR